MNMADDRAKDGAAGTADREAGFPGRTQEGEVRSADEIIDSCPFRRNVFNLVPEGTARILDFGCGDGGMLLRLRRDRGCSELYGAEADPGRAEFLRHHIDGVWTDNIELGGSFPEGYEDFFNIIILHDVVEHLLDPWFTLTKLRSLLAPGGRMLVATPNFHFWQLQHTVLGGEFPYGPGLWHTGHLRWYTPVSFVELLLIGGLAIRELFLEIHYPDLGPADIMPEKPLRTVQLPPAQVRDRHPDMEAYTIRYPQDIRRYYPVFFAHKLIADCEKDRLVWDPQPMTYHCPRLHSLREAMNLPYTAFDPPPMTPLFGPYR